MKIINEYLITLFQSGPSNYEYIAKIVEIENGNLYEIKSNNVYVKIDRDLFDKRIKFSEF